MYSRILVVDLEATCDEVMTNWDMEVIEIGACWLEPDGSTPHRFQTFVRPVTNPHLTGFCSDLTGIHQSDVDIAPNFPAAAKMLDEFVQQYCEPGSIWSSWGEWDRRQLERESVRHSILEPIPLPHLNAKRLFAKVKRVGKEVGMAKASQLAGLALDGTHHRALDDSLNVAKLLRWIPDGRPIESGPARKATANFS